MLVTILGFDLTAFLNQPLQDVVSQLILYTFWIPVMFVVMAGLFEVWVDVQREYWRSKRPYILMAIDVPRLTEQSPKAVENIFAVAVALKSSPTWLETNIQGKNMWRHSFEITSIDGYIQFYIWTEERYQDAFEAAVYAQYPDAEIALVEDYVKGIPDKYPNETHDTWGIEYSLDREPFYPIRTWMDFEHSASRDEYLKDPLTNLFEGFAKMKPGEQIWFQLVTEHAGDSWKKDGDAFINKTFGADLGSEKKPGLVAGTLGSVVDMVGTVAGDLVGLTGEAGEEKKADYTDLWKAFKVTEQEREITKAVVRKIAKPGLACKIRTVYIARKEVFSKVTRKDIVKGTMKQLTHQDLNGFGGSGSPDDDYFWQVWWYAYYQNKMIRGYKERSMEIGAKPSILNIEEMATLWHFPTVTVKVPLVKKTLAKRAEPPASTPFASEDEEFMVAPTMILPQGQEGEEGPGEDIFAAPMAIPPSLAEELPPMPARYERTGGSALPTPTPPTHKKAPAGREVMRAMEEPRPEVVPPTPHAPTSSAVARIPDAIRVLIEQGVEPEDVGIDAIIKEDNDL